MNSCKKMTVLISQQLDRRLTLSERCALRLHLMMCRGCRNFERNMAFMHDVFSSVRRNTRGEAPVAEEK